MEKRGFTLIELLITLAIIGILAGVAVTSYTGATRKAARSEAYTQLESLRLLQERFRNDNANVYAPSRATTDLVTAVFLAFRPGNDRNFDYVIVQDVQLSGAGGNTTANPPGTTCDAFAIDCNNNKNY